MSHDTKHNTDNLIETLCDDLCEIKVMRHPCRRIVPWIIFAVAYIGLAISIIGLRYDFFTKIHEAFYIFELLLVVGRAFIIILCLSDVDIASRSDGELCHAGRSFPQMLSGCHRFWCLTRSRHLVFVYEGKNNTPLFAFLYECARDRGAGVYRASHYMWIR